MRTAHETTLIKYLTPYNQSIILSARGLIIPVPNYRLWLAQLALRSFLLKVWEPISYLRYAMGLKPGRLSSAHSLVSLRYT